MKIRQLTVAGSLLFVLVTAAATQADSIVWDGGKAEGVYVVASDDGYYICDPRDGSADFVPSAAVDPADWLKSEDRMALRQAWKEKQPERVGQPAQVFTEGSAEAIDSGSAAETVNSSGSGPQIVEKRVEVDEEGRPTLVLKGTAQEDPARQQALAQLAEQQALEAQQAAVEAYMQYEAEQEQLRAAEQEAYENEMRALRLEEQRLRVYDRAWDAWYSPYRGPYRDWVHQRGWGSTIGPGWYIGPWEESPRTSSGDDFGWKDTYPWVLE